MNTKLARLIPALGVAALVGPMVIPAPAAAAPSKHSRAASHVQVVEVTGTSARLEWILPKGKVSTVIVRYTAGNRAPTLHSRAAEAKPPARAEHVTLRALSPLHRYWVSVFLKQPGKTCSRADSRRFTTLAAAPAPTPSPPKISTAVLPSGMVGAPYSAELTTADGRAGQWSIASGGLPAGLSLTGASITGTPLESGSFPVGVTFSDTHAKSAAQALTVVISPGADGTEWLPATLPTPSDAQTNPSLTVSDLSCAPDGFCVAVGEYSSTSVGSTEGLILTRSDGSWSATRAPVPGDLTDRNAELLAVSCPDDGDCFAAGYDNNASGGAFLDALDSSGWNPIDVPAAAAEMTVSAISCATTTTCTAVGGDLALHLQSGTWTATNLPLPADAEANPTVGVSKVVCSGDSACTAVGGYGPPSDGSGPLIHALIETLSGSGWTATEAPLPPDADTSGTGDAPGASLSAVSCPDSSTCMAIGRYVGSAGTSGLIETDAAGAWTGSRAPLPVDAASHGGGATTSATRLADVACPSMSQCVVVGEYGSTNHSDPNFYHSEALIDQDTDGQWTSINAPLPSDAAAEPGPDLTYVACSSTTHCVSAGSDGEPCGAGCMFGETYLEYNPLIEVYDAGVWQASTGPSPDGRDNLDAAPGLQGLACPDLTDQCFAVGNYSTADGDIEPVSETEPAQ